MASARTTYRDGQGGDGDGVFRRAVAPLTEMLDRPAADSSTAAGERLKQRYRELRAHLLHLVELADGLGNLLSNVLQANLTEVSVRPERRHAPAAASRGVVEMRASS